MNQGNLLLPYAFCALTDCELCFQAFVKEHFFAAWIAIQALSKTFKPHI